MIWLVAVSLTMMAVGLSRGGDTACAKVVLGLGMAVHVYRIWERWN